MDGLECSSLAEVRENIDRIDRKIVGLIAARGRFVKQAARFKKTREDVAAAQRAEQVIAKVRTLSEENGANPDVTEKVYRAMIAAFIDSEIKEYESIRQE